MPQLLQCKTGSFCWGYSLVEKRIQCIVRLNFKAQPEEKEKEKKKLPSFSIPTTVEHHFPLKEVLPWRSGDIS